jgi:hypothetical protein
VGDDGLIDRERIRRQHAERVAELRAGRGEARIVTRAKVRIVKDFLKEAQLGKFTIRSDEHAPAGTGEAPTPLQIFVAGVGF